jgi:transcriptional regulator with XRE-family HTH domain
MTACNATTHFSRSHGTLLLAVAMDPKQIGRRIAEARERKGWTQLAFALEANVSPSTVQRWESGKLPPVRELMRVAELLEVEPEQLVELAPTNEDQVLELRNELARTQAALARIEEKLDAALPSRRRVRASG